MALNRPRSKSYLQADLNFDAFSEVKYTAKICTQQWDEPGRVVM